MSFANTKINAISVSALLLVLMACVPVTGRIFVFSSSNDRAVNVEELCSALESIGFKGGECQFTGEESDNWKYLPVFELSEDPKIMIEIKHSDYKGTYILAYLEGSANDFSKLGARTLILVESLVSGLTTNYSVSDLN